MLPPWLVCHTLDIISARGVGGGGGGGLEVERMYYHLHLLGLRRCF